MTTLPKGSKSFMRKVPEGNLLQYPHVTGQNMTKLNVCMLAAVEPRAVTAEAMAPNRHRWHRRLEDRMANSGVTSTRWMCPQQSMMANVPG